MAKVRFDTSMAEKEFSREEIRAMRRSYGDAGLDQLDADPFIAFADWLRQAHENPLIVEANAMVLSTLGSDLMISTRTVLLKDISQGGFTFFTNYESRKAHAIENNDQVSCFFLGMQWSAKYRFKELLQKLRKKKLPSISQRVHGVRRLVRGQVTSHHHLLRAKSSSSVMKVRHKSGPKEALSHAHHIGVAIA
jgi:hypothetical protein